MVVAVVVSCARAVDARVAMPRMIQFMVMAMVLLVSRGICI